MRLRKIILLVIWLVICQFTGYLTTLDCKPIYLTQDEVESYKEIADTVWYKGVNSLPKEDVKQFDIYFSTDSNTLKIVPLNPCSESITVDFSSSKEVTIKEKAMYIRYSGFIHNRYSFR